MAMASLKKEGKVRNIGVSNFSVAQMRRAQAIAPITSLQPRYSLVHRDIEDEILPFVAREGIGVIAYSPMASGLLTGAMTRERIAGLPADDWRKGHADFREPQLSRNLELVSLLQTIGQRHGRTPGEVAVAWVLGNPAVTAAIVGARRPDQVRGLSGAADLRLSAGERAGNRGDVRRPGCGLSVWHPTANDRVHASASSGWEPWAAAWPGGSWRPATTSRCSTAAGSASRPLEERGAKVAETPGEVTANADVIARFRRGRPRGRKRDHGGRWCSG